MTTIRYSPVGNEPQKSICTVCHGVGGSANIWSGSGWVSVLFAWQAWQTSILLFASWSILGNQTFSLSSCLVFMSPWCPSWAIEIAFHTALMEWLQDCSWEWHLTHHSQVVHLSLAWIWEAHSCPLPGAQLEDLVSCAIVGSKWARTNTVVSCLALLLVELDPVSWLWEKHLLLKSTHILRPMLFSFLPMM